jgi:hypothetical protein
MSTAMRGTDPVKLFQSAIITETAAPVLHLDRDFITIARPGICVLDGYVAATRLDLEKTK